MLIDKDIRQCLFCQSNNIYLDIENDLVEFTDCRDCHSRIWCDENIVQIAMMESPNLKMKVLFDLDSKKYRYYRLRDSSSYYSYNNLISIYKETDLFDPRYFKFLFEKLSLQLEKLMAFK